MKKVFLVMMAAVALCLAACSSDDSGSGGSADDYLSGKMFTTQEGNVYFFRNGSFLYEAKEVGPSGGMIGGFDHFQAVGTWDAVGDMATTVVLANNIGMDVSRRNVPEKIRIDDMDGYKHPVDPTTGEWISFATGFGFTDTTNAGASDNGVIGRWRTDFYPKELGISERPEYYADLASDGTATLCGKQGSGLEVKTTYTASRGKITFEQFLNGKRETFYYAIPKSGDMYFYDTSKGNALFCWYKQ